MSIGTEKLLDDALKLSAAERAALAEELLSSLDRPDPELDKLWAEEAEARLAAVKRGETKLVSEEEVFGKWEKP